MVDSNYMYFHENKILIKIRAGLTQGRSDVSTVGVFGLVAVRAGLKFYKILSYIFQEDIFFVCVQCVCLFFFLGGGRGR